MPDCTRDLRAIERGEASGWERRRAAAETGSAQQIETAGREQKSKLLPAAQRKQQSDQRKHEYGQSARDRAVDRTTLVLGMAGERRAVRPGEAQLVRVGGCAGSGGLRRHHTGEHGLEDERIGGDPANQPAPRT